MHESVELVKRARKRSAVPFANAVLRKLASRRRADSGVQQAKSAPSDSSRNCREALRIRFGWWSDGCASLGSNVHGKFAVMISTLQKQRFVSLTRT